MTARSQILFASLLVHTLCSTGCGRGLHAADAGIGGPTDAAVADDMASTPAPGADLSAGAPADMSPPVAFDASAPADLSDAGAVAADDMTAAAPDLGNPADLAQDATPPAPDLLPETLATPRLVAPLSTSTATQRRPTLQWLLSAGGGTPIVDLCSDRACATPLPGIVAQVASNRTSAVPSAALPAGWVYWRVRVILGSQVASSATWQLWIGQTSASSPVDSSYGSTLDVNGDGYADFLIGAGAADGNAGAAHLYFGGKGGTFQRVDLTSPDGAGGRFGTVAGAGDVNGDGYGDFLVAAPGAGAVHLYFGNDGGSALTRVDLANPDGASAAFGSIAGVGDVNRDGYADFVVGAPGAAHAHLYLGAATPAASDWNGATAARRLDLTSSGGSGSEFGQAVAGAGDVNGDGFADFVVGAPVEGSQGAVHVYLGEAAPSVGDWNGATAAGRINLPDPDATPESPGDSFGGSLAGVGDVNGDGYTDFLVGAPNENDNGNGGVAHLYLGEAAPSASRWGSDLAGKRVALAPPLHHTTFAGALAGAGDVNGDGFADFLIGAVTANGPSSGAFSGAAYIYLGEAAPSASDWNGTTASRRVDIQEPDGSDAWFGVSVAAAGDVDGDLACDFLVGAAGSSAQAGAAHLYLGASPASSNGWNGAAAAKRIDLANPDGAGAQFGSAVASADARAGAGKPARRLAMRAGVEAGS